MKSKVFISLLVALVMLFTLTVPALAGKPAKGELIALDSGSHPMDTGKVSLQGTRGGHLKVTVVLTGGDYPKSYLVYVDVEGSPEFYLGNISINPRGRGRFTHVTSQTWTGTRQVTVLLKYSGVAKYQSDSIGVTFP